MDTETNCATIDSGRSRGRIIVAAKANFSILYFVSASRKSFLHSLDPEETFEVIGLGPLTHIDFAILAGLKGIGCMAKERVQRRLAAILAADVVGYSRMMKADEAGTLTRRRFLRGGEDRLRAT